MVADDPLPFAQETRKISDTFTERLTSETVNKASYSIKGQADGGFYHSLVSVNKLVQDRVKKILADKGYKVEETEFPEGAGGDDFVCLRVSWE
jgi:hypothetical protein